MNPSSFSFTNLVKLRKRHGGVHRAVVALVQSDRIDQGVPIPGHALLKLKGCTNGGIIHFVVGTGKYVHGVRLAHAALPNYQESFVDNHIFL